MINKIIETDELKINVFNQPHNDWHKVLAHCLLEDNWLRSNYMPRNLKIEDHEIFYIAYTHDWEAINFGGIKKTSNNVARALNRMYTFPEFRSAKKLRHNQSLLMNDILPACESNMSTKFPLTFISMQMRDKAYAGEQRWWKYWKEGWLNLSDDWKTFDGLVQVVNGDNPECYQNIVYRESSDYTFKNWNPKTLSYQEFSAKFG